MIPSIGFSFPHRVVLLGWCVAAAVASLAAAENTLVTVAGARGARLRVEAVDPGIVRLRQW